MRQFVWLLWLAPAALGQAELRLPVTADTNLSSYPSERTYTYGARPAVRVKGIEMFWLVRFDPAPLAGRRVLSARFYCKPLQQQLRTLGFATIAAEWVEDRGQGNADVPGTCWLTRGLPGGGTAPWALPGGDFTDISLTNGGTLCAYAEVRREADGWLSAAVEPALLEACASGLSAGLCISDETGQTRFNNDLATREQANARPYFTVVVEPAPPPRATIGGVTLTPAPSPDRPGRGGARLAYTLTAEPADLPRLRVNATVNGQPLERWRIPPATAGENVILLDDLPPQGEVTATVTAAGATAGATGRAGATPHATLPPPPSHEPLAVEPRELYAVPGYVAVHPRTGNVLEEVGQAAYGGVPTGFYRRRNPVWGDGRVELAGARGEIVSFQIVVVGDAPPPRPQPPIGPDGRLALPGRVLGQFALHAVPDPEPVPEVAVPLELLPRPELWPASLGQRFWSVVVDLWLAPDARPGVYETAWRVGERELPVRLTVWRHRLPDDLSFAVSLNSYGRVHGQFGIREEQGDEALAIEEAYHRLAHEHRLTWCPLTYNQAGVVEWGAGPALAGEGLRTTCDFADYDRRWRRLLDGAAFADLPRDGVPLDHCYLPFCENWPGSIADYAFRPTATTWPELMVEHALQAPPIQQAFPLAYQDRFIIVARAFARHVRAAGWTRTRFQGYFNNKYNFKDPKQGGRGSSWWLLDEPMHRDDWLALAFFHDLFRRGTAGVGAPNVVLRADISRPQWQRDWLNGLVDVEVVGGALYDYRRRVTRWLAEQGATAWHYATANRPGVANVDAIAWCLRAWLAGADGIVPWNSIGGERHFEQPEPTALLLPGSRYGHRGPLASVRLKAFREGQQEVERLALLAQRKGWSRTQTAEAVAGLVNLSATARQRFAEDAGVLEFGALSPDDIERLRRAVAAELERLE